MLESVHEESVIRLLNKLVRMRKRATFTDFKDAKPAAHAWIASDAWQISIEAEKLLKDING